MSLLTPEQSGHSLVFYRIDPVAGGPVDGNVALVLAAASSGIPEQSSLLEVVAAEPPGAKEVIAAPSACWSLSLLRRDEILQARSNLYTVGAKFGKGSHGDVYNNGRH